MRYLFAVPPEVSSDGEDWADGGDPVVPQFPHVGQNHWLSLLSFKPAPYARVQDHSDVDIDGYAEILGKQYPGLPQALHAEYVLTTAKLAHMVDVGERLQIYITPDTAKVLVLTTEEWIELWKQQPLP